MPDRSSPVTSAEPYWEACARHELRVPRCTSCGTFRFPPTPACPHCRSFDAEWALTAGRGTLYSWAVGSGREDDPDLAVIALVDLEEGVRIVSNLVECAPEAIVAGLPVEVTWRDRPGTPAVLAMFRPAPADATTEPDTDRRQA